MFQCLTANQNSTELYITIYEPNRQTHDTGLVAQRENQQLNGNQWKTWIGGYPGP